MQLLKSLKWCVDIALTDAEFCVATRDLSCQIVLEIADSLERSVINPAAAETAPTIVLSGPLKTWDKLLNKHPPVGYHSFAAVSRQNPEVFVVRGDPLLIAQSLHALERLFEILRGQIKNQFASALPDLHKVEGRYCRVELPTKGALNVYFERSGRPNALALVMLHTAGGDARQYHYLIADSELQEQWSMYAFDMPSHGRTMPVRDELWQDYRLTKQHYEEVCLSFLRQVVCRPAVMLGCSMGAAMSLQMAQAHPEDVAGVIALECPLRSRGRRTLFLAHPNVNQTEYNPSYVRGLMSPYSTLGERRNAVWIYSQGGFQVYSGDLAFYSDEFDAERDLQSLNGNRIGVSLLTGAYDYSATPEQSALVAKLIPGARFTCMPDLGHFPMVENPEKLLSYLKPELDYVRSKWECNHPHLGQKDCLKSEDL